MSRTALAATTTATRALDLFRRRGFLFPTAPLHGGLRGGFDLGPVAAELRRNIERAWWRAVVHGNPEIRAYESPILTPAAVLRASGHVANFADLLVDDKLSGARFRADKTAPFRLSDVNDPAAKGLPKGTRVATITAESKAAATAWVDRIANTVAPGARVERQGKSVLVVLYAGYANPTTNNPFLTAPRPFNLLLKTHTDTADPLDAVLAMQASGASRAAIDRALEPATAYLRPETAQGIYAAFPGVARTLHLVPPFGLAQAGKSFRNEIRPEHSLFRTLEFEQLEMQYFVHPTRADAAHARWTADRLAWWKQLAAQPDAFRTRDHTGTELAHYARACSDVEFAFPWGWGEIEGVANRTDYDLQCHATATGASFAVTDRAADAPQPRTFTPFVVETSAGLSRAVLAFLYDAYHETVDPSSAVADSESSNRPVLRLHPTLAPTSVHVLPVVGNRPALTAAADRVWRAIRTHPGTQEFSLATAMLESRGSIGKRYQYADETGVPVCVTVDDASVARGTVWVRHRDTREQIEVPEAEASQVILTWFADWKSSFQSVEV
ncbi:hypothetical protein BC828DRAFT_377163 [Blastocladiella britannica]|nr:hypothetical protein BC828DRAFT_377163 [Blastocladiella britannica]